MSNEDLAAIYTHRPDGTPRHASVVALLKHFRWLHLPATLQVVSQPVGELAFTMADTLPENAELSAGLRKLLEAKDCLVRAALG